MMPLRFIAARQILARSLALPHRIASDPLASATAEAGQNSLWRNRRSGPFALAAGARLAAAAARREGGAAAALAWFEGP